MSLMSLKLLNTFIIFELSDVDIGTPGLTSKS